MAKKSSATKTGRVLAAIHVNGLHLAPDTLIVLPSAVADAHIRSGHLDCDPAAVDYCKTLGAQIIEIADSST